MANIDYYNADAPFGVVNLATGVWVGVPGTEMTSRNGAFEIVRNRPGKYRFERNPADVFAESVKDIDRLVPFARR